MRNDGKGVTLQVVLSRKSEEQKGAARGSPRHYEGIKRPLTNRDNQRVSTRGCKQVSTRMTSP